MWLSEHKHPSKCFYQYMKQDQSLPSKNIFKKTSWENDSLLAITIADQNHHTPKVSHIDKAYNNNHKIDIVDQIVNSTSTETFIRDLTPLETFILRVLQYKSILFKKPSSISFTRLLKKFFKQPE